MIEVDRQLCRKAAGGMCPSSVVRGLRRTRLSGHCWLGEELRSPLALHPPGRPILAIYRSGADENLFIDLDWVANSDRRMIADYTQRGAILGHVQRALVAA